MNRIFFVSALILLVVGNSYSDGGIISNVLETIQQDLITIFRALFYYINNERMTLSRIIELAMETSDEHANDISASHGFFKIIQGINKAMVNINNATTFIKQHENQTIFEVIKEIKGNPTMNEHTQVATNLTKQLMRIPAIKELVGRALGSKINGVPFAVTLMMLARHIGNDFKLGELTQPITLLDMGTNASYAMMPFLKHHMKNTWPKIRKSLIDNEQDVSSVKDFATRAREYASQLFKEMFNSYTKGMNHTNIGELLEEHDFLINNDLELKNITKNNARIITSTEKPSVPVA